MSEIQNKFSTVITEKYEISAALQPTTIQFPKSFGSATINLRDDAHVVRIDSFVAKYPNQKYFKAKVKAAISAQKN